MLLPRPCSVTRVPLAWQKLHQGADSQATGIAWMQYHATFVLYMLSSLDRCKVLSQGLQAARHWVQVARCRCMSDRWRAAGA